MIELFAHLDDEFDEPIISALKTEASWSVEKIVSSLAEDSGSDGNGSTCKAVECEVSEEIECERLLCTADVKKADCHQLDAQPHARMVFAN